MSPTDAGPPEKGAAAHDDRFLRRAVELGRRGWGRVHPNPLVGCVLVRNGLVVGEGWHREYGGPHAEVEALRAAGERARDATAYVSLEPCRHRAKTPPCTEALIEAGVGRVVFGARDPSADAGGGGEVLRAAGVDVDGPRLDEKEGRRENPRFHHRHRVPHRPYLALKLAVTLDGKLAEAPGTRTSITGAEAAAATHRLRAGFDGILVGGGTARVDDPLLTVRGEVTPRVPPTRVVLSTAADVDPKARLFQGLPTVPLLVLHGPEASAERLRRLASAGAALAEVHPGDGGLDLVDALARCRERGLEALLCEGGGKVAAALVRAELVDRIHLFVAPRALGDRGVPAFPGAFAPGPWEGWEPAAEPERLGRDVHLVFDRER